MKKTKIIINLFLIIFLSVFLLCGCKKNDNSKLLIGTWYYSTSDKVRNDIFYEFKDDNTGKYYFYGESKVFTYEIDDKKLTIKYEGGTNTNSFDYKIENNVLTIKDNNSTDVTYKKK